MAEKRKADEKDFKAWLLAFEKLASKPVVVSLLIQKGEVHFFSCSDKNRFFDSDEECDCSGSEINLDEAKNEPEPIYIREKTYIG